MEIQAPINFDSKINIIILVYIAKLRLKIRFTKINVQKINNFILKMFKIILANFQVENKIRKARYF